jgi:hypothetical protein
MKTVLFLICCAVLCVTVLQVDESVAIAVRSELRVEHNDEVITGTYEGYQNGDIRMLLQDETRKSYHFRTDKTLLRRISRTPLSTRVTITVEKGIVVSFEEASK